MSRASPVSLSGQLSPEDCAKPVSGASLRGKSVLITGGASGMGAGIAARFAEKG